MLDMVEVPAHPFGQLISRVILRLRARDVTEVAKCSLLY